MRYTVKMKIYKELLTDHFRSPRNKGTLPDPDFATEELIPSCGDRIGMQGIIKEDMVIKLMFTGSGCVISQAAASLLTERALKTSINELLLLDKKYMLSMLDIQLGPMRIRCALLALDALQKGIRGYIKKSGSSGNARSAKTSSKATCS